MKLLRNLLFWIVIAALGALLAQLLLRDPGQLLLRYGGSEYDMTLASALLAVMVALAVLWLLLTLVTLPFRAWRGRQDRRSRAQLGEGLEALHRGEYASAEKLLVRAADDDAAAAGVARTAAAQAAMGRGDAVAAAGHLEALTDRHAALRAIGRAELALSDDRPADALVALDAPAAQPLPPAGLALRAKALSACGQSADAYGLLGPLRQQQALTETRLADLESEFAEASLRETTEGNALAARWDVLSSTVRTQPRVVMAYADRAAALGWDLAAIGSVESALDARWDEALADYFGRLPVGNDAARQAIAERWLPAHAGSASLLLTLARLHRRQGDTRQADEYLQRALAIGAGPAGWEESGHALAAAGHHDRARVAYANALREQRGEAPDLSAHARPLPHVQPANTPVLGHDGIDDAVRDQNGVPRLPE